MANIQLTFSQMRQKADELERKNKELRAEASQMQSHQQRLTQSWDGEANDAFDKAFRSDMIQFANFSRLIDDYIRVLRTAISEYEKAELANKQLASDRSYH